MGIDAIKKAIRNNVAALGPELERLSVQIHDNPETGWQEYKASSWIADFLAKGGFRVEMGVAGLPTAFRATYGKGKPTIAFLAEYDALPDIGHGCGHNIIGTAATGAGMAARPVVDEMGGTVVVMGCPAEELLGGKVVMIEKGAFNGLDVALMIHPSSGGHNWVGFRTTASMSVSVEFWGKEAHAAAAPWHGASSLEALILAFNSVNALRAHFRENSRVNGIITDGGKVPNMIPDHSSAVFMLRANEDTYLEELSGQITNCFEGSARATRTRVNYQWGTRTKKMRLNQSLIELWARNIQLLGLETAPAVDNGASSDIGNVSALLPCLHPFLAISPIELAFHSREFARASVSEGAKRAVIHGAAALAMTAADLLALPQELGRVKDDFLAVS